MAKIHHKQLIRIQSLQNSKQRMQLLGASHFTLTYKITTYKVTIQKYYLTLGLFGSNFLYNFRVPKAQKDK